MVGPFTLLLAYISHTPMKDRGRATKRPESSAFSGPKRGRKVKTCRVAARETGIRPCSPCIITIIPVRCKASRAPAALEGVAVGTIRPERRALASPALRGAERHGGDHGTSAPQPMYHNHQTTKNRLGEG